MAVTYTNIWYTKILKKLKTILSSEYPKIPIFIRGEQEIKGTIYFEIYGNGQDSISRDTNGRFTNLYFLSIDLYFTKGISSKSVEQYYNYINRTEQLIANNSDVERFWYDGNVDSINVNAGLSTDEMISTSTINFSCRYTKV